MLIGSKVTLLALESGFEDVKLCGDIIKLLIRFDLLGKAEFYKEYPTLAEFASELQREIRNHE